MAHMTSAERAKVHMKKLRAKKKMDQALKHMADEDLTPEQKAEIEREKAEGQLKSNVMSGIWDMQHNQLPVFKIPMLRKNCHERLEVIERLIKEAKADGNEHPISLLEEKENIRKALIKLE